MRKFQLMLLQAVNSPFVFKRHNSSILLDIPYEHDKRWGDGNGFSHVRAALMKPSLTVFVVKGMLTLGTWQQIVFMDFDNRGRDRKVVVQVMGE